jgi:hypothetical protein
MKGNRKYTCSRHCSRERNLAIARQNRVYTANEYDKLGMRAVEAVKGLEPVSRRKRSIIMGSFLGEVMTLEDEVAMVFSEASLLGRGVPYREVMV